MSSSRRLPVYLLIDTSGSMRGEPVESVNVGLRAMQTSLRQNPYAIETVHLSVTTFDSQIKDVLPLTALEDATIPEIVCPPLAPPCLVKHSNTFWIERRRKCANRARNRRGIGPRCCSS